MTPFRRRVCTPIRTHLCMPHIPRILAVEEHVLQVRSLQILRLENNLEVRLGESCTHCPLINAIMEMCEERSTLISNELFSAVIEARRACFCA